MNERPSPAERYAAAMERQRQRTPELERFRATLPFELDPFQEEACAALERGRGVLVAAPTGAGKTVVGLFGVHLALARGRTIMYTTPIKALSNQKYAELRALHGEENVGLLTGDVSVNPRAPVIVMTTEVLRNMLYNGSRSLEDLDVVVMDEVHYLADRFRGPVWEEVIIHLPARVQVISLSATVSNAEEFGQWLTMVRGDTEVVVWEHRPVPLWQHVMVGGRLFDLYSPSARGAVRPNPELLAAVRRATPTRGRPHRSRIHRPGVVAELDRGGLLPAISFIFSRAGCDAAVDQVLASGLRLTSDGEAAEIRRIVDERCGSLPPEDLGALGWVRWASGLDRGVAAHHAGLSPLFKEVVEELFALGLLKVVHATETLALGINMPARSVVLEKLVKWNGSAHVRLTPGEYTQLTGRAGRRGIDVEGHAVVLWSPDIDVEAVAGLASKRTYPLRSAFRATYNMSVNLLATLPRHRAREVLQTSFAQFQADRGVVGLARQVRQLEEVIAAERGTFSCDRGDVEEYLGLRAAITAEERRLAAERARAVRQEVADQLDAVRPHDVLEFRRGRRAHHGIVHEVTPSVRHGVLLDVVTTDAKLRRLDAEDLGAGLTVLGNLRAAGRHNARSARGRSDLAALVRDFIAGRTREKPARRGERERDAGELDRLRSRLRGHPCHTCPDIEEHARAARRYHRALADRDGLLERISHRTGTIAAGFDRLCDYLRELGYLGEDDEITPAGQVLRSIYSERDLLMAECLREGVWSHLGAAELAGAVSLIVFETRGDTPGRLDTRDGALRAAVQRSTRIWARLEAGERRHGIDPMPPVDPGLVGPIHRWAAGESLSAVLADGELTPGDFVRWAKQVLDVLDQLMAVEGAPAKVRARAQSAHEAINRGIVGLSSV